MIASWRSAGRHDATLEAVPMSRILALPGAVPRLAPGAVVLPGATVVGDVTLADDVGVWYGAVLRGDVAPVTIGAGSNVQDTAVLHADPGFPASIGERVTIGHGAVVHGATVGDDCLIGMRATVLNGARIEPGCLIAAGAVVPPGARSGRFAGRRRTGEGAATGQRDRGRDDRRLLAAVRVPRPPAPRRGDHRLRQRPNPPVGWTSGGRYRGVTDLSGSGW
jgi:carbonic anhydrase/acetyltransferase-like protein (isoleucine patch superfamily)